MKSLYTPVEPGATYICQETGRERPERRQFVRPANIDPRVEHLFMGFANIIYNMSRTSPYWHGYLKAMRDTFAEYTRDVGGQRSED